jgi:hypothetical protein
MASWSALILAALQVISGLVQGSHKIHKKRKKARVEKVERQRRYNMDKSE